MPKFIAPEREAGFFITAEEKAELEDQATELLVKAVEYRKSPFGDGMQYVVTVDLDDAERGLSYNEGVGSRDSLLNSLKFYLENEDEQEPVIVTLIKVKSGSGRPVNLLHVVGSEES